MSCPHLRTKAFAIVVADGCSALRDLLRLTLKLAATPAQALLFAPAAVPVPVNRF